MQRLAGGDVRVNLRVGDVGEVDLGGHHRVHRAGGHTAHDPDGVVAGVEHTGLPAHATPALGCRIRGQRLAVREALELQHRVAPEDHAVVVRRAAGDILGLGPGEVGDEVGDGHERAECLSQRLLVDG